MSMRLSPQEWLNQERVVRGFSGASQIDRKWIDQIVSKVPLEDQQTTRDIWLSRIGKTVGEIHDEQMEQYKERFKLTLSDDERKVADECYFGILPTREFNAYAGKTPWGDRVVILHEALTHIVAIWCHWYTRSSEEGGNTLNTEERQHMMLKYFVQVWNEVPVSSQLPDIYPSTKEQWSYSETLAIACMNFVMGHEIGHVIHNHKGYSNIREANHLMEYQADEKGMEICIKMFLSLASSGMNDDADAYLLAPLMFVGIISLFGDKSSNTHPSATMRKEKIQKNMSKMLKFGEKKEFDKHLLMLFSEVEQMFLILSGYASEVKVLMSEYTRPNNSWLQSMLKTNEG